MPRKNWTPGLKIRLRDSQRRSRARQKELIQDLQRRVQQYEEQGVQATLAMQQAARSTARENDRLRALLAHHGILSDEVERFLLSGDVAQAGRRRLGGEIAPTKPDDSERRPNIYAPGRRQALPSSSAPAKKSSDTRGGPNNISSVTPDNATCTAETIDVSGTRIDKDGCSRGGDGDGGESNPALLVERASLPLPALMPGSVVDSQARSLSEMSCGAAAAIIASVEGHGDETAARAALGCPESKDCMVKNVRVFDLIDTRP